MTEETPSQEQFLWGLGVLVGAILAIADLPHAVQVNIEYNASREEIAKINKTMSETAVTVRKVKSFSADVLYICKNSVFRTEKRLKTLSTNAEILKQECFERASSLAECAQICQTAGRTTLLSFIYRIRWGILFLCLGLALHFSPFLISGVPTALATASIAIISASAATISVPSLYHVCMACKQVKEEWSEVHNSTTELNGIAKEIDEVSKILQTLSEKSGECLELGAMNQKDQWESLEKTCINMTELCDKALDGMVRVPVLKKRSFWGWLFGH